LDLFAILFVVAFFVLSVRKYLPGGPLGFFEAAVEERLVNSDLEYRARMHESLPIGGTATGRIV
jgi:hypothetical protein